MKKSMKVYWRKTLSKIIGNYILETPLSNKDAGCSKWGFGKKGKTEFFIKEFLTPIYPDENVEMKQTTIERKRSFCREFESHESMIIKKINQASDGNTLRIHEFFRYGTKYYIVTEKVNAVDKDIIERMNISINDKVRILKVLSHSLSGLHKNGIVHGDIKMNNILFMLAKNGMITAKIIDIDGCFFENNPPIPDYLVVDPVYMAPEMFEYIATEEGKIDCKADVFAMGIVFYQILTGMLPDFHKEKYEYAYQYILSGGILKIDCGMEYLNKIIAGMLCKNSEERFTMEKVFNILCEKSQPNNLEEEIIVKQTKKDEFFTKAGNL